jgi:hypothetical protein
LPSRRSSTSSHRARSRIGAWSRFTPGSTSRTAPSSRSSSARCSCPASPAPRTGSPSLEAWDRLVREHGGAPLRRLDDARVLDPGAVEFVALIRRDENILPAVARLSPERAAVELLVSAGAPLPSDAASAANGLRDALSAASVPAYLVNEGAIGGGEPGNRAIDAEHVERILDAIVADSIEWEHDPDFGYETAAAVPGIEDSDNELLCPRLLYGRTERPYEYAAIVERLNSEVADLVGGLDGLDSEVAAAAPSPAKRGRPDPDEDQS